MERREFLQSGFCASLALSAGAHLVSELVEQANDRERKPHCTIEQYEDNAQSIHVTHGMLRFDNGAGPPIAYRDLRLVTLANGWKYRPAFSANEPMPFGCVSPGYTAIDRRVDYLLHSFRHVKLGIDFVMPVVAYGEFGLITGPAEAFEPAIGSSDGQLTQVSVNLGGEMPMRVDIGGVRFVSGQLVVDRCKPESASTASRYRFVAGLYPVMRRGSV